MVEGLFLAVPLGCQRFVTVVFPDHTHLLFSILRNYLYSFLFSFFLKEILHILDK